MRHHKKTKESGFFEGDWDSDAANMGKAMKRTNVFTSSESNRKKVSERHDYTQEELDTHIRSTEYSKKGTGLLNVSQKLRSRAVSSNKIIVVRLWEYPTYMLC